MPDINIIEAFAPLFDEQDPHYNSRYLVWYGGRGSGKTVTVSKGLLIRGMKKKERILCCREFQNSISDSVFKQLCDDIADLGLDEFYSVTQNSIKGANGTEFLFKGLRNNIQSVKSTAGVTLCHVEEAQTVSSLSWDVLIPTIREEGSQIIITFNPDEEDDPTYQRFVVNPPPDSYVRKVNYDENKWLPETLRKEMEYAKRDTDNFNHVWLGMPRRAGLGAVYGKEMAAALPRITNVPYTPAAPVYTFWDLGYSDHTAIWFAQTVGKEPRAIDYYENNMESLDHYAQIVRDKGYNYAGHILPHDAGHKSLRTGTTLAQQLEGMGLNNIIILPVDSIATGIELVRQLIPQMWFDAEKCKQGIHCLRKYHYRYDEERKMFSKEPVHDWSSNGADAARYMATYLATMRQPVTVTHEPGFYSRNAGVY